MPYISSSFILLNNVCRNTLNMQSKIKFQSYIKSAKILIRIIIKKVGLINQMKNGSIETI